MQLKSNTLCWNPMEAYYFTCANEDYKWVHFSLNLYRKNEMRVNKSYHLFLPQPLYLWYEESGCSCKCAHGSCIRCTGCGLFTYRKGVCIRQLWQNNPNLSKKQRPQQVSVVWKGQGEREREREIYSPGSHKGILSKTHCWAKVWYNWDLFWFHFYFKVSLSHVTYTYYYNNN